MKFIPYFTTSRYRVDAMVELSKVEPGEKVVDLGSGDGRIAIAFAKTGALVDGYELDKALIKESEINIEKENVTSKITILNKDFWEADLSSYNVVCVYPMPDIMKALETKLKKELRPGTKILTNYYLFPNLKTETSKNNIYLYIK